MIRLRRRAQGNGCQAADAAPSVANSSPLARASSCAVQAGILVVLVLAMYLSRAWWLTGLAQFLVVSDPVRPVDVIIVLGGGRVERAQEGAALYAQGIAKNVIATGNEIILPALRTNEAEQSALAMERLGVPKSAIALAPHSESTFDDARLSRALMEQHGWHSAIVVSDPFHLRRASLVFGNVFRGSGMMLLYHAPDHDWWSVDHWWERNKDAQQVVSEYIKFVAYLVQGRLF